MHDTQVPAQSLVQQIELEQWAARNNAAATSGRKRAAWARAAAVERRFPSRS